MRKLVYCLTLVVFALSAMITVSAQTTSGRLVGTVQSPDGVLPGSTVVITDIKNGKETTVTTNDEGSFTVANLEPGDYTVKITAAGFKTTTANITIQVGQEYSLPVTLE